MRELIGDLRGSPDLIAVLVLCLALGVARQPLPSAFAEPLAGTRNHWTCVDPVETVVDAVQDALSHLDF
jgi:hypothetical protein